MGDGQNANYHLVMATDSGNNCDATGTGTPCVKIYNTGAASDFIYSWQAFVVQCVGGRFLTARSLQLVTSLTMKRPSPRPSVTSTATSQRRFSTSSTPSRAIAAAPSPCMARLSTSTPTPAPPAPTASRGAPTPKTMLARPTSSLLFPRAV